MRFVFGLCLVFVLAGCLSRGTQVAEFGIDGIRYTHDDTHDVSCWVYQTSLSCLPDSQVTLP